VATLKRRNSEYKTIPLKYIAILNTAGFLLNGKGSFVCSNMPVDPEVFKSTVMNGFRKTSPDFLHNGKNNEILHAKQTKGVLYVIRVHDLVQKNLACVHRVIIG
jgi:hypothetical protein